MHSSPPTNQWFRYANQIIYTDHTLYKQTKPNTAWKSDSVLTRVGWVRLCSWPGCTVPDRTGPGAGLVSLWEECRGRKQEPLAAWPPSGWKARGSNCSVLHHDLRSVGWTLGRSPWQCELWTTRKAKWVNRELWSLFNPKPRLMGCASRN